MSGSSQVPARTTLLTRNLGIDAVSVESRPESHAVLGLLSYIVRLPAGWPDMAVCFPRCSNKPMVVTAYAGLDADLIWSQLPSSLRLVAALKRSQPLDRKAAAPVRHPSPRMSVAAYVAAKPQQAPNVGATPFARGWILNPVLRGFGEDDAHGPDSPRPATHETVLAGDG